jgi:hypothetical protein
MGLKFVGQQIFTSTKKIKQTGPHQIVDNFRSYNQFVQLLASFTNFSVVKGS